MSENESIYLPLKPNRKRRFGLMVQAIVPAFLLIITALSAKSDTVGGMLLRIVSAATGGIIIYGSVKDFKKPGSGKWMGIDTSLMFSGMLLIAQGSWMYKPEKEFQPAHLLFLTALVMIFKGVMFPESKVKTGFEMNRQTFSYKRFKYIKRIEIPIQDIDALSISGEKIIVALKSAKQITINLRGFEIHQVLIDELTSFIKQFQQVSTE